MAEKHRKQNRCNISVSKDLRARMDEFKHVGEIWESFFIRLMENQPATENDPLDREAKEYFTTTKQENIDRVKEEIDDLTMTPKELLNKAAKISGIDPEQIILEAVEMYAQKLITQNTKPNAKNGKRGVAGSADNRIKEVLNRLLDSLLNNEIDTIAKTKLQMLSGTNIRTVNKFLERQGLTNLFLVPFELKLLTDEKYNLIKVCDWISDEAKAALLTHVTVLPK